MKDSHVVAIIAAVLIARKDFAIPAAIKTAVNILLASAIELKEGPQESGAGSSTCTRRARSNKKKDGLK